MPPGRASKVDESNEALSMGSVSGANWTAGQQNADPLFLVVSRMPDSGELILVQVPELEEAHEMRIEPSAKPFEISRP